MKAVVIDKFGENDGVAFRDVDDIGSPRSGEAIIRVAAAGLNRADLLQARGLYPPPAGIAADRPGLEFAGEIAAIGEQVEQFAIGDRVMSITAGEAQSEFVRVNAASLVRVPDGIDLSHAAAIPEAFITAHDAMFTLGKLSPGDSVLIHAAGLGVGLAAIQIAHAAGCRVIGTSRTQEKLDRCFEFGMDDALQIVDPAQFADSVTELTDGQGVDVILDLVGGAYFEQNLLSLALKGRLILVGLTSGSRANFDLGRALRKRATITGTVLRSRPESEKSAAINAFAADIVPLFDGKVRPVIDRIFPAADAVEAYRYLASNESFGKVLLEF